MIHLNRVRVVSPHNRKAFYSPLMTFQTAPCCWRLRRRTKANTRAAAQTHPLVTVTPITMFLVRGVYGSGVGADVAAGAGESPCTMRCQRHGQHGAVTPPRAYVLLCGHRARGRGVGRQQPEHELELGDADGGVGMGRVDLDVAVDGDAMAAVVREQPGPVLAGAALVEPDRERVRDAVHDDGDERPGRHWQGQRRLVRCSDPRPLIVSQLQTDLNLEAHDVSVAATTPCGTICCRTDPLEVTHMLGRSCGPPGAPFERANSSTGPGLNDAGYTQTVYEYWDAVFIRLAVLPDIDACNCELRAAVPGTIGFPTAFTHCMFFGAAGQVCERRGAFTCPVVSPRCACMFTMLLAYRGGDRCRGSRGVRAGSCVIRSKGAVVEVEFCNADIRVCARRVDLERSVHRDDAAIAVEVELPGQAVLAVVVPDSQHAFGSVNGERDQRPGRKRQATPSDMADERPVTVLVLQLQVDLNLSSAGQR